MQSQFREPIIRTTRRILGILIPTVALGLLLVACGSNSTSMHGPTAAVQLQTPTPASDEATSPAGSTKPVVVQVTLSEFSIRSSITTFHVGVPYRFVVTNEGCATHELMVMQPIAVNKVPARGYSIGPMSGGGMMGAMYCDGGGMPWSQMFPEATSMSELDAMALATVEEDDLGPGKTHTLELTFTQAYPAGTLEFACHLPGHYELGMELPISVS